MKQKLYLKKTITLIILVLFTSTSISVASALNFQETIDKVMGNISRESRDLLTQNSYISPLDVDRNTYDNPYFAHEEKNINDRNLWNADSFDDTQAFEQGVLLVKFKPGVNVFDSENILASVRLIVHEDPSIAPIRSAQPVFSEQILHQNTGSKQRFGLDRWVQLVFTDENTDILSEAEKYRSHSFVEDAEPNYIIRISSTHDPYFGRQWALQNKGQKFGPLNSFDVGNILGSWVKGTPDADIDAPEAWDVEQGSPNVTIAVVDTGVDYIHPDLKPNMWSNKDEIPENGIDDDNNGYIDDYYGYDFCSFGQVRDSDPMDVHDHGTHCSGIIAAASNNRVGIAGICQCRIMAVKFLNWNGVGYLEDGAAALIYAADNGADVISNSWGGYFDSQLLQDAIDYAAESSIVVAAAGNNDAAFPKTYPAGYHNVIAVAATNYNDEKASFSNYGNCEDRWVDIAAPGVYILSTTRYIRDPRIGASYAFFSGTSMACPHVAGVMALVKSHHYDWSNDLIIGQVLNTADNIDLKNPDYKGLLGSGRVNAYAAVTKEPGFSIIIEGYMINDSEGDGNGFLNPGETVQLQISLRNNWAAVSNVTANLSTLDPYVTILSSNRKFGDLAPQENSTNDFCIRLNGSTTYPQYLDFTLVVSTDDGYEETVPFHVAVQYPFHPGWPFFVTQYGWPSYDHLNVGDIDGNGDLEVVLTCYGEVYAWNHHGKLLDGWPVDPGGINYRGSVLGDLDGDGHLEIVFGEAEENDRSEEVHIFNFLGEEITDGWPKQLKICDCPALADIDNDGKLEIIVAAINGAGGDIYAFNFNGSTVPGFPVYVEKASSGLAVGDVNNDGFSEIVIASMYLTNKAVYVISHSGEMLYQWQWSPEEDQRFGSDNEPVLADLDNDGLLEILLTTQACRELFVWRYNGEELFKKTFEDNIIHQVVVGDINSDGYLEIVVQASTTLYVFDRHGNNVNSNWPISLDGMLWWDSIQGGPGPIVADIDGDNEVEIIVSPSALRSPIYAFNGDGSLVIGFPIALGKFPPIGLKLFSFSTPIIADLDQDGNIELCSYTATSYGGLNYMEMSMYDLPYRSNAGKNPWPMFQHDSYRSGTFPRSLLVAPGGNRYGLVNESLQFTSAAYGGSLPYLSWLWEFGDGNWSSLQNPSYVYHEPGVYTITLTVEDNEGVIANATAQVTIKMVNTHPPSTPTIPEGKTWGGIHLGYLYNSSATDLDNDPIYYLFDWGDGTNSGWVGPYPSGVQGKHPHQWRDGTYHVRVQAKDVYGAESSWSDPLEVVIEDKPPVVVITKPEKALYVNNKKILPLPNRPIIIGDSFDINVNATDSDIINTVRFYIDGALVGVDNLEPYTFSWPKKPLVFHYPTPSVEHTIKIVAWAGYPFWETTTTELTVWRLSYKYFQP